jgi:hypothetical protein
MTMEKTINCECLVVGGSLGGVAAALALSERGYTVCLTEETDWLGGQATSQGVSALDEFWVVEQFGTTASYARFRQLIRNHYLHNTTLSEKGKSMTHFNPGNAWVSKLCYEPKVGVQAIEQMLQPYIDTGRLQIFYQYRPVAVITQDGTISQVEVESVNRTASQAQRLRFTAAMVLDATDLGDLLPLAGIDYVSGTQGVADTGEAHAYPGPSQPDWVQSFTYPFAVEYCPGENHTIPKPPGYEYFRDTQTYTFNLYYARTGCKRFMMFPANDEAKEFWNYRRLIDAELFSDSCYPHDIAMINWPGNDYDRRNLIDKSWEEQLQIRDEAKRLSLGLLYWLQTEAPRDDGGTGYPELKLRPDIMGTSDGLSKYPYIRESRRIRAVTTVKEEDLSRAARPNWARAKIWQDSVGIGYYFIDTHACSGGQKFNLDIQARPYQVPLSAMLAPGWNNFLPACKNIGVTHIANGAYRLHPTEWSIGEAAGHMAAYCLEKQVTPHKAQSDPALLREFQLRLVRQGKPLYWYTDVPDGHPAWEAVQYLSAIGVITPDAATLVFEPDAELDDNVVVWEQNLRNILGLSATPTRTRAQWAQQVYNKIIGVS